MPDVKCVLIHDNFQNFKSYNIPKAQLVIADIPYNIGTDFYASGRTGMWTGTTRTVRVIRRGKQHSIPTSLSTLQNISILQPAAEERTGERREGCTVHDCVLCFPADPEGDH